MENDQIALTDLVKNLGYKNHSELANKIRDLLSGKENFNKYIIDTGEQTFGRPEKTHVTKSAKTLVDNLAILYEYPNVFGRAPIGKKDYYPPYHELLKTKDKNKLTQALLSHKATLTKNIERSSTSLKNLPIFGQTILNQKSIDITKDSLRQLMNISSSDKEFIDLGNAYELGAWNDILELQNKIESGEPTSINYQRLGEKLKELGNTIQALDALEKSIVLDPTNGISHAILSVLLYEKLINKKNEVYEAQSRNDFSGFIENPISSEEYWINEKIEDSYDNYTSIKYSFINSAIEALFYWPNWGELNSFNGNKNYYMHLNQDHTTSIKLERDKLFIMLIDELTFDKFLINKNKLIEIIRSFQQWDPEMYPSTTVSMYNLSLDTKANIFKILSWISDDDILRTIKDEIKNYNSALFASNNLSFIKRPLIQQIFRKHIGKTEYKNMLNSLLKLDIEHKELDNLTEISRLYLMDIRQPLIKIEKSLEDLHRFDGEEPPVWLNYQAVSDDEIEEAFMLAIEQLQDWANLLKHPLWLKNPYSSHFPHKMLTTIMFCSLLELRGEINVDKNIEILQSFNKNEEAMKISISDINTSLLNEIFKHIKENDIDFPLKLQLTAILEIISQMRESIDQQIEEESYYI